MLYRPVESLDGQLLCHPRTHGISHNFTGTLVLNACEIEPAFCGSDVRDVHMPDGIWPLCNKLLFQEIRGNREVMVRLRSDFKVAALFALKSHFPS